MKKIVITGLLLFGVVFFVTMDANPQGAALGFGDYINLVFLNFSAYPIYGQNESSLVKNLWGELLLSGGVVFVTIRLYDQYGSFRRFLVHRYRSYTRYIIVTLKHSLINSAIYVLLVAGAYLFAVLIVDKNAFFRFSLVGNFSPFLSTLWLIAYLCRIMFGFTLFGLLSCCLLTRFRPEVVALCCIGTISACFFLGKAIRLPLLTTSMEPESLVLFLVIPFLIVLEIIALKKIYKRMEL